MLSLAETAGDCGSANFPFGCEASLHIIAILQDLVVRILVQIYVWVMQLCHCASLYNCARRIDGALAPRQQNIYRCWHVESYIYIYKYIYIYICIDALGLDLVPRDKHLCNMSVPIPPRTNL